MPGPTALWITAPGRAELRPATPGQGALRIAARFGGISRGTERLVLAGRVPESEYARMRAPMQEGDFPFPVKYGYATVGRVLEPSPGGPPAGAEVFVLHPHQDVFACSPEAAIALPEGVPAARAVLGANMETALNIAWDGGVGPGDRVVVVGAGVVGALAGYLCARVPGTEVTLIDIDPARAALAARLGCGFARPQDAPAGADLVIHASASAAGLATALGAAGTEARVVESSWYGAGTVPVPLGGGFHSGRLQIVGSQVGRIPPARAPRWSHRRRLTKALELLADPALDALISGEADFRDLPERYAAILDDAATLCHRIRYSG